jgi:hypothetical protein
MISQNNNNQHLIKIVKKYYAKESIVKNVTSYILYYQISLGYFTMTTTHDNNEAINKIKELSLIIEPNTVLISIMELIQQFNNEIDFDVSFDKYLQTKALFQALNDFSSKDKDLLNKDRFIESKRKDILDNLFFNTKMKMQYLEEYPTMLNHYTNLIDDEYSVQVQDIMISNLTG